MKHEAKRSLKCAAMASALALTGVLALNAETTQVTWSDTNLLTIGSWGEPSSWVDAGGTALTVAPTTPMRPTTSPSCSRRSRSSG